MRLPVNLTNVRKKFSKTHKGIDFGFDSKVLGKNQPIYASEDGVVIYNRHQVSGGYVIHIKHNNGYVTEYAHLKKNSQKVKEGQNVTVNVFNNNTNNNNDSNNLFILVNSLLLVLFTICFVFSSISNNKRMTGLGCIILIGYFAFNSLINMGYISLNTFNKVDDFSNMNLSQVIKWASDNKITINEEYEYSDMIAKQKSVLMSM